MDSARREGIIDLAKRLAQRERLDPSWVDYPTWAGTPPGAEELLARAARYREWAAAIFRGDIELPEWVAREDRIEYLSRDPYWDFVIAHPLAPRSAPSPGPSYFETIDFDEAARAWCAAEQRRTAPKPERREVLELAHRLGALTLMPNDWVFYPEWASYPEEYGPMLRIAAKLKKWAAAILAHEEAPPKYLIHDNPTRWAPPPETGRPASPAPGSLARAERFLHLRAAPLAAALLLRAAFASPPRLARPPPQGRWLSPRRPGTGIQPSIARPERKGDSPTLVLLFDNRIVFPFRCGIATRDRRPNPRPCCFHPSLDTPMGLEHTKVA